ncbi:hypothetical protein C2845_PM16G05270 [Panicum miliaceum]|uniref:RING-type E3 ubiquitin transferase n=1 Tax=Panicum miliaceum TaxID=4540 RepID=A0A3L6PSN7_PANMI|nr:hypothetical protein C2845_PM16G05270 [Panicum miliaceum]
MDWSEEGFDEEEEPSLRRRRGARPRSPTGGRPSPDRGAQASGSRSPSPPRGAPTPARSRSPSPPRVGIVATRLGSSVRTTRTSSPPPRTPAADATPGGGGGEDTGVEEIIAKMREGLPAPAAAQDDAETSAAGSSGSGGGGGGEADEEEDGPGGFIGFSFQELEAPPGVDGAEVLDAFAGSEEARKAKAAAEFLEATMGANTGPRTDAIKMELLANGRVLDLEGLERWMRRMEAVSELEWFTGLCCDEANPVPQIELFECVFRALGNASAGELHHGADARRRWIGPVVVPQFVVCPISNKVMENPVVIASGKTVDRSALEEWWKEHRRICPITGEVLTHTMFIPNILIKLCIERWRAANKIPGVTAAADPPAISPEVEALFMQVTLMPHSPRSSKEVRDALFLLHDLLNEESSAVHLIGRHPGTIAKLASVLPETCLDPDPELDDIIVGVMAKAASYDPNKAVFGDDPYAIPVLIARALLGPVPMRARCAHILGLLANDHYNKIKIGELGGFAPLVELLRVGDKGVKTTAARAIASLCEARENRSRFQREGVVDAAISALRSDGLMVEAEAILLQTTGSYHAVEEVIFKLRAFQGDEMCQKMATRLWRTFVLTNPEDKRDVVPSMPASKEIWEEAWTSEAERSSASSEGSAANEKALRKQIKQDVKLIVSWLQKRCYFPRTYRYRD